MATKHQTLATLVRNARTRLGLSVRDLARQVKKTDGSSIAPSYVTDIEKGRAAPSREVGSELARALSINTDILMAATDEARAHVHSRQKKSLPSSKRKTLPEKNVANKNATIRETLLNSKPIAIDLFAGIGGLSLGLENAGFFSAVHVEVEEKTSRYAEYNFPLATHYGGAELGDIRKLSAKKLVSTIGDREVSLIAGGPPCQGFSMAGRGNVNDPLNDLVLEMARLVLKIRPRAFLIENVPGIRRESYWQLDSAIRKLSRHYAIQDPTLLSAPDYGVPQTRKRVFIIGYRKDLGKMPRLPDPTHSHKSDTDDLFPLLETPTVIEAIGDLPDCDQYPQLIDGDEVEYDKAPHSAFAEIMRSTDDYDRNRGYRVEWNNLVCSNVRRTQHGKDLVSRLRDLAPDTNDKKSRIKKLSADGLSTTIRAGTTADRGAWSAPRPCHPNLPRVITTRECARIQTFPDWFRFHPSKWHGNRQVGNAVPPLLATAVGRQILLELEITPMVDVPELAIRDTELVTQDIDKAKNAGLSTKKVSHKVTGTDAKSRRRSAGGEEQTRDRAVNE